VYLLYLDESGNEDDAADRHFVLGGAAVFERNTFFLSRDIDAVQTKHFPGAQPIPFHASPIRSGRGFWRGVQQSIRQDVLTDVAGVIANAAQAVALFAAVIEKSSAMHGEAAVEHATEQICNRFDLFLKRRYHDFSDPQRGLLIFSEGRFDKRAKIWVRGFRDLGTKWGTLSNLADIPYFASMRENRLLQVADFVAHAAFLLYERRDASLIRPFINRFDQKNGTLHGLVHHRTGPGPHPPCDCPGCHSRSRPGALGPWI
jgi:hypothetical protein